MMHLLNNNYLVFYEIVQNMKLLNILIQNYITHHYLVKKSKKYQFYYIIQKTIQRKMIMLKFVMNL